MKETFFHSYLGKLCLLLVVILLIIQALPHKTVHRSRLSTVWKLPLNTGARQDWRSVYLEADAHFLAWRRTHNPRKPRRHTGIDLQNGKYWGGPGEPVYAMATGKVLGVFDSHPHQRIVIEHQLADGRTVWSAYIHITASRVRVGDFVDSETVIARRLNQSELNQYGSEYNHVHIEIMKKLPPLVNGQYQWMSTRCYSESQVTQYFYNPKRFLSRRWQGIN